MATGVQAWSKTAAANATADTAVNWAEGMAPSAVNDSARQEMASVAKWRDDISGSIVTGGIATAYTVFSNQGLTATAGTLIAFAPHTTSGSTVTLAVDSIGAEPLRSAPGVELPAGMLIQGTPYTAIYATSNGGEWILQSVYGNPYGIPVGGMMPYLGATAPNSSFVLPFGQAISRTTYATLFALTGTTYGVGDGTTTFNVIDMRGRIPVAQDNMGGTAAGRVTTAGSAVDGTTTGATGGAQNKIVAQANLPNVNLNVVIAAGQGAHTHSFGPTPVIGGGGGFGFSNGSNAGSFPPNVGTATLPEMSGIAPTGGSGTPLPIMPPVIVLPLILRIV